ncbi:hypothetical protein J2T12_003530 [Paenibacillus anaericanus]|nr:hypothetical protein [Paenibacillus anaericanus]
MTTENWEEVVKISVCEEQKNLVPLVIESLARGVGSPSQDYTIL